VQLGASRQPVDFGLQLVIGAADPQQVGHQRLGRDLLTLEQPTGQLFQVATELLTAGS
jgi:hypothetical protein